MKIIFIVLFHLLSVTLLGSPNKEPATYFSNNNKDTVLNKKSDSTDIKSISNPDSLPLNKVKDNSPAIDIEKNDLLKIWVPAIVAIIALFITNLVVLWKIKKETSESLKKELILARIKLEKEKLERFYDPILTILSTNSDIFNSFGPKSFPDEEDLRNEASIIWDKMVENIIIPNNRRIANIITSSSHLIHPDDKLSIYLDYLKHLESFEHFIKFPNSMHKNYKYPPDFLSNVSLHRELILEELLKTENKLVS